MIIFDLDGTLADCEHRRHFVDPEKIYENNKILKCESDVTDLVNFDSLIPEGGVIKNKHIKGWKPDWKAFFENCFNDNAIWPVVRVIESLHLNDVTIQHKDIQIWSGRCESVRNKTEHWLKYIVGDHTYSKLLMRPIGNTEPDEVLKERWLDEAISRGKIIDMAFDDRKKVIDMWRRRGIFVFDCYQETGEF